MYATRLEGLCYLTCQWTTVRVHQQMYLLEMIHRINKSYHMLGVRDDYISLLYLAFSSTQDMIVFKINYHFISLESDKTRQD